VSEPGGKESPQRTCPICGKPTAKEHDPFCSKRCAQVDLNRWLSGTYVIPGKKVEDPDEQED
jgi:endogenous inhibitor of DNA gyrase (YacG/DUF329 family)